MIVLENDYIPFIFEIRFFVNENKIEFDFQ